MSVRASVVSVLVVNVVGALACAPPIGEGEGEGDPAGYRFEEIDVASAGPRWGWIPMASSGATWFVGGADISLETNEGAVNLDVYRVDADGDVPVFTEVPTDVPAVGAPLPRYCGCAAIDEDNDELLVVGGRTDGFVVVPDAWWVSLATGAWTQVEGEVPPGSVGCGVAFVPGADTAYLFGGGSNAFASGKTFKYDAITHTFAELDLATAPTARFDHNMRLSLDHTHIWLTSGTRTTTSDFLDDVWRFDVASETWSELPVTGARPPGRRTPWLALAEDDSHLLMGFGARGLAPESDVADLWRLDFADGKWTELTDDVEDMLAPRAFQYFLRAPEGVVGYVYGGTDMENALSDVHALIGPDDTRYH